MRGDKWTKNAQTSKHGAGYVDFIRTPPVVERPQDVNPWTINPLGIQSTIPSLVRRTSGLCPSVGLPGPAPPPLLDISICPEVMMRSNNGRGEEATVSREGVRSRGSELIERAEAAALHGGFQPTPSWARMKHYNYGFQVKR